MIQIRQSKQPATVIRLDSLFAHGHGPPSRRFGSTAEGLGNASTRRGWRVLSVIAWFQQLTVRLAQGRFMKIAELKGLPNWQATAVDNQTGHAIAIVRPGRGGYQL